MQARWDDPAWRKKYSDGIRWYANQPATRARSAEMKRRQWQDPEFRRKMVVGIKKFWATKANRDAMIEMLLAARLAKKAARAKPTGIISAEEAADAMTAVILEAGGKKTVQRS